MKKSATALAELKRTRRAVKCRLIFALRNELQAKWQPADTVVRRVSVFMVCVFIFAKMWSLIFPPVQLPFLCLVLCRSYLHVLFCCCCVWLAPSSDNLPHASEVVKKCKMSIEATLRLRNFGHVAVVNERQNPSLGMRTHIHTLKNVLLHRGALVMLSKCEC